MIINIQGVKYDVSEKLRNVIISKLKKFDRYFSDTTVATVVCKEANKGVFKMELTIKLDNNCILRSEVSSDNMYDNIDFILPKIERQIRKHKTKLANQLKSGAFVSDEGEEVPEEVTGRLVKTKVFNLECMTAEEAIARLDLVGNDFYVFYSKDNDRVNVVYKRKDNNVGLIDLIY